jgi:HSP20 family protein
MDNALLVINANRVNEIITSKKRMKLFRSNILQQTILFNNKTNKTMYHSCYSAGCGPAYGRAFYGNRFGHPFSGGFKRPKYNVPMNITETDKAFLIELYATGFSKEDISLKVENDVLLIIGKKENSASPNFTRQEFPIKNFERTIYLNGQIDVEQIAAKSVNGVLEITLPKTELAQRKEHKVDVQ